MKFISGPYTFEELIKNKINVPVKEKKYYLFYSTNPHENILLYVFEDIIKDFLEAMTIKSYIIVIEKDEMLKFKDENFLI